MSSTTFLYRLKRLLPFAFACILTLTLATCDDINRGGIDVPDSDQCNGGPCSDTTDTTGGSDPEGEMGPLDVSTDNPRYFETPSGDEVYLTGSHTWANLQDTQGGGIYPPSMPYSDYLDMLTANGHNFIRLWMWENETWALRVEEKMTWTPSPYLRTGPGEALDGKPKFDLNKFNPDYFERLRKRVKEAGDRGIYVSVMFFQGWSVKKLDHPGGNPWEGHPYNSANNINDVDGDPDNSGDGIEIHTLEVPEITKLQEAYIQKVIDTLNDLDNVLYEICNECGGRSTPSDMTYDWLSDMVISAKQYQDGLPQQHPVGMTSFSGNDISKSRTNTLMLDSPADWISPRHVTTFANPDEPYIVEPPITKGDKVSILDTDHTGMHRLDDPKIVREWVWKSFLRGHHPIYMDYGIFEDDVSQSTVNAVRSVMGHALNYAQKMELSEAKPSKTISSTGYALVDPGHQYLVYAPTGDEFTVNLVSGPYSYEWVDPRDGTVIKEGDLTVSSSGPQSFTPPSSSPEDALLYITGDNKARAAYRSNNGDTGISLFTLNNVNEKPDIN